MFDSNDEIFQEYVAESREQLSEVESILLEMERSADNGEVDISALNTVFRTMHSIKGTGGFLDLENIVSVTHRAESLLDLLRSGSVSLTQKHVTVLCKAVDFCNETLSLIENTGSDRGVEQQAGALIEVLSEAMCSTESVDPPAEEEVASVELPQTQGPVTKEETTEAEVALGDGFIGEKQTEPDPVASIALKQKQSSQLPQKDPRPTALDKMESPKTKPRAQKPKDKGTPSTEDSGRSPSKPKQSIRVDLDKLDSLLDLVGELIVAENMVTHNPDVQDLELENFQKSSLHLNRITRNLQDLAMSVRMIPIRATFRKMLRLVRDLGQKLNKDIALEITGEDTEVDKTVIENIADPLIHLIRNSVDHGLEATEDRIKVGKPARGTIRLDARHEGGEVWIVVTDDGKGLVRDNILAKARDRGLVRGSGEQLSDTDVFELIFEPGFSTAGNVTDVSGRGVGMDVVRRNIQKLGGRIDIASKAGAGTRLTMRIPLTLAIIEGMHVRVGQGVYTIPMLSIRESISPSKDNVNTLADGTEVYSIRGKFLPIIRIYDLYQIPHDQEDLEGGVLVIVDDGDASMCLFVDELLGQRQTVIKALPSYMGNPHGISGCSILSSGDISLILDVKNLIAGTRKRAAA